MTFKIGDLELSYANGYVVYQGIESPKAGEWRASPVVGGSRIYFDSAAPKGTEFNIKVTCLTRSALVALMAYDIRNFYWPNENDTYLIEDSSRRWLIKSCSIAFSGTIAPFDCDVMLAMETPNSLGETENQKAGTATSSPTSISSIANGGAAIAQFSSIQITGKYAGSANLAAAKLTHSITGYELEIADVLHDEAILTFYPKDHYAFLSAVDPVDSITRTDRNKSSSSGVTYASGSLLFANSASLVMRYQIGHPLLNDPILTLSITDFVGDPVLEVSNDGNYWWEVDRALEAGNLQEYTLTKLTGLSDFRWRIVCDSDDSMKLSRYLLESYHSISGQRPLPYVQAEATVDALSATFSAGNMDYDIRWRDTDPV